MERRLLLLAVTFLLVTMTYSPALAVAPLGTPTAGLKQGQFSAAFEYAIGEADLEVSGHGISETLKDVESNAFLANLGYGITDDWEFYVLLGVANVQADDLDFDGDYGFAYGLGTKYTFARDESLSWGAMFQIDWNKSEDKVSGVDIEFDYYEMTIAVGPTYELSDTMRIYGGPFFYFLNGDLKGTYESMSATFDLEEESMFGGYVGLEVDLDQSASIYGEFQFTGDAWTFGTGIGWKF